MSLIIPAACPDPEAGVSIHLEPWIIAVIIFIGLVAVGLVLLLLLRVAILIHVSHLCGWLVIIRYHYRAHS